MGEKTSFKNHFLSTFFGPETQQSINTTPLEKHIHYSGTLYLPPLLLSLLLSLLLLYTLTTERRTPRHHVDFNFLALAEQLPPAGTTRMRGLLTLSRLCDLSINTRRNFVLTRPVNHESILAQTPGNLADCPYARCADGTNPYAECVLIPGSEDTCAGCHYNSLGSRCSYRDSMSSILSKFATLI